MTTPIGAEIPVDWICIRDTIQVNDALRAEIQRELDHYDISPTARLALVAREITHDTGYALTGLTDHPLLLVAETYRGNGGAVDSRGRSGSTGPSGTAGKSGQGQSGRAGGPGGPGGPGQPGGPASEITVLAHTLSDLRLVADGGPGGAGGRGGPGGPGHKPRPKPNKPDVPFGDPGPGGAGGPGGNGAAGGPAAALRVETVTHSGLTFDSSGGAAGEAGRGGGGGKHGGAGEPIGPEGPPGSPGPAPGASVGFTLITHTADDWWALVRTRLGARAREWADYRASVGEYFFRLHYPGDPQRKGHRDTADHEFGRALVLAPDHEEAARLSRYLAAGLAPVGHAYDLDILPDFPRFEGLVANYQTAVLQLLGNAANLLTTTLIAEQAKERLEADVAGLVRMGAALQLESEAAETALEAADSRAKVLLTQIGETQAEFAAIQEQIATKRMEFPPGNDLGLVVNVAIAAAQVAAAVATGGATIIASLAVAGMLAASTSSMSQFSATTGRYTADGTFPDTWWQDKSDPDNPKIDPKMRERVVSLKGLAAQTGTVIDATRTVFELFAAKVDGELENKAKALIIKQVELTREAAIQKLEVQRATLLKAAADTRIASNKADIEHLENLAGDWANDIGTLGRTARTLIKQTQSYVDVLITYSFYAHRALNLWMFREPDAAFGFDIGHLHPDVIADTYQPVTRGDQDRDAPVAALLRGYELSWARIPELALLAKKHEEYTRLHLDYDVRYISVKEPAVLDALRAGRTAAFTLGWSAFPAKWTELKADYVRIGLLGATARTPTVSLILEHSGRAENKRHEDGTKAVKLFAPARSSTVPATFGREPQDPPRTQPAFWGRSPVGTWRVTVEKLSAEQGALDLSGLKELFLTVPCWFYRPPESSPAQPVVEPMALRADFSGDGKPDTAVWQPADGTWRIEPASGGEAVTVAWGLPGDIPVPADYDGDGKAEPAVFRPSNGKLYARPVAGPPAGYLWRTAGYEPAPAEIRGMDLLANAFRTRAADLTAAGRHTEAVEAQQQARAAYEQLTGVSERYRRSLAQTLVVLGLYLAKAKRTDEAITAGRQGVAEYRTARDAEQVAWALGNLAWVYDQARRYADAAATQQEAVTAYRTLTAERPAFRGALAKARVFLSNYLLRAGRASDAESAAREAVAGYRELADRPGLAWALGNLAPCLQAAGRPGEGADVWGEARAVYQALAASDPAYRPLLANSAYRQSTLLVAAGRRAEAKEPADQAVTLYRELAGADPGRYLPALEAAVKLRDSLAAQG
ncbi:tetratricopeptide repeat protein [Streptomyces sp. NPDC051018]|uniref:tetratricopeptide repeat protein n=1 Tax=Streptomyces sp. NPDC051018 TaxID=3365639 RepID=UPI0037B507D8